MSGDPAGRAGARVAAVEGLLALTPERRTEAVAALIEGLDPGEQGALVTIAAEHAELHEALLLLTVRGALGGAGWWTCARRLDLSAGSSRRARATSPPGTRR